MPISDWAELMPHTITYRRVIARDAYGKAKHAGDSVLIGDVLFGDITFDALPDPIEYQARVNYKTKRVASRVSSQDVIASGEVWVNGLIPTINVDDEIVLPDGSTPIIITWEQFADEVGDHHMKIYFGSSGGDSRI